MFDPKNRIHWVGAIIIAIILILILGVASTAAGQEPDVWGWSPQNTDSGPCGGGPEYVVRDSEPRIQDPEALREGLLDIQEEERPDVGGRTLLWACVLTTGRVSALLVHSTSGDPILDSIALRVIADARYTPATYQGQPITVWIAQPVDFIPRTRPVEL